MGGFLGIIFMWGGRKESVILKIERRMNYLLVGEREFLGVIKEGGEWNMERG